MSKPFRPHKKQETLTVEITKREAVLIEKLRRHAYGQFIVHKADGLPVRVEIKNSELIEEDTKVNL